MVCQSCNHSWILSAKKDIFFRDGHLYRTVNVLPLKFKYLQSTIVINPDLKILSRPFYNCPQTILHHIIVSKKITTLCILFQTMFTKDTSTATLKAMVPQSSNWLIGFWDGNVDSIVLIWSWGITAGFEKTLPSRFSHLQLVNCQWLIGQFIISAGITLDRSTWIAYNHSVQQLYVPHNLKNINSRQIK